MHELDENNDDGEDCSVTTDREYLTNKARKRKASLLPEEHIPKLTRNTIMKTSTKASSRNQDLSNRTVKNDKQDCTQRKAPYDSGSLPKRQFLSQETKPENSSLVKPPSKWSKFT